MLLDLFDFSDILKREFNNRHSFLTELSGYFLIVYTLQEYFRVLRVCELHESHSFTLGVTLIVLLSQNLNLLEYSFFVDHTFLLVHVELLEAPSQNILDFYTEFPLVKVLGDVLEEHSRLRNE